MAEANRENVSDEAHAGPKRDGWEQKKKNNNNNKGKKQTY